MPIINKAENDMPLRRLGQPLGKEPRLPAGWEGGAQGEVGQGGGGYNWYDLIGPPGLGAGPEAQAAEANIYRAGEARARAQAIEQASARDDSQLAAKPIFNRASPPPYVRPPADFPRAIPTWLEKVNENLNANPPVQAPEVPLDDYYFRHKRPLKSYAGPGTIDPALIAAFNKGVPWGPTGPMYPGGQQGGFGSRYGGWGGGGGGGGGGYSSYQDYLRSLAGLYNWNIE